MSLLNKRRMAIERAPHTQTKKSMASPLKIDTCNCVPSASTSDDQSSLLETENLSDSARVCCKAGPRSVLTIEQAREIFRIKTSHGHASIHAASNTLALRYHVSAKAIRDIWKGRSWLEATYDLWNDSDRPARRMLGRPKGRKDSKPRKVRSLPHTLNISEPKAPIMTKGFENGVPDSVCLFKDKRYESTANHSIVLALLERFRVQTSPLNILNLSFDTTRKSVRQSTSPILPPIHFRPCEMYPNTQSNNLCQELPGVNWLLRNGGMTQEACLSPSLRIPVVLK
jgi:hypothetical protein